MSFMKNIEIKQRRMLHPGANMAPKKSDELLNVISSIFLIQSTGLHFSSERIFEFPHAFMSVI